MIQRSGGDTVDNPKKIEQIGVRVTSELRQKIREEAERQKRKEAQMVTVILEEYFDSIDRVKKIAERK